MNYINHVTLNTGNARKTTPNEVNKEIYFILKRLYNDSLNGKVEVFDGYTMKTIKENTGTVITLYSKNNFPILTTAISKSDKLGILWNMMHDSSASQLKTRSDKPIELPYIADRIEPSAVMDISAMSWTGDFSRCMGWIVLSPEKIR